MPGIANVLRTVLELSTAHMPCSRPTWGSIRACDTEYGWIVYIAPGYADIAPKWLRPIVALALEHGCFAINFDCNGDTVACFPTYKWEA